MGSRHFRFKTDVNHLVLHTSNGRFGKFHKERDSLKLDIKSLHTD